MTFTMYRASMKLKALKQKLVKAVSRKTDLGHSQRSAFAFNEEYRKVKPYKVTRTGLPFVRKQEVSGGQRYDQILNQRGRRK